MLLLFHTLTRLLTLTPFHRIRKTINPISLFTKQPSNYPDSPPSLLLHFPPSNPLPTQPLSVPIGKQVNTYSSQLPLRTTDTSPRRLDCVRLSPLLSVVFSLALPFLPSYVSFHKIVKATRNQKKLTGRNSSNRYRPFFVSSFFFFLKITTTSTYHI